MQGKIGESCFWQNKLFTMQIYGIILMMLGSKGILPQLMPWIALVYIYIRWRFKR